MKRTPYTKHLLVAGITIAAGVAVLSLAQANDSTGIISPSYVDGTMIVKVFYGNEKLGPKLECTEVFPVERIVPKTGNLERAALSELVKGPTEEEKEQGYFTSINAGTLLKDFRIGWSGVAYADFSRRLSETAGSCNVLAIYAEIESTLRQFPNVKDVVISVEGETEGVLEP